MEQPKPPIRYVLEPQTYLLLQAIARRLGHVEAPVTELDQRNLARHMTELLDEAQPIMETPHG